MRDWETKADNQDKLDGWVWKHHIIGKYVE